MTSLQRGEPPVCPDGQVPLWFERGMFLDHYGEWKCGSVASSTDVAPTAWQEFARFMRDAHQEPRVITGEAVLFIAIMLWWAWARFVR